MISFDEAKTLLSRVAMLDNRKVDASLIMLWQEILDPYTLDEALWALREFARNETSEYLRPAHLVAIIRRKRAEYADANPGRTGEASDWLDFENKLDQVVQKVRQIRALGNMYAVEAMEKGVDGEP